MPRKATLFCLVAIPRCIGAQEEELCASPPVPSAGGALIQRYSESRWSAELQGSPGASALLAAFMEDSVRDGAGAAQEPGSARREKTKSDEPSKEKKDDKAGSAAKEKNDNKPDGASQEKQQDKPDDNSDGPGNAPNSSTFSTANSSANSNATKADDASASSVKSAATQQVYRANSASDERAASAEPNGGSGSGKAAPLANQTDSQNQSVERAGQTPVVNVTAQPAKPRDNTGKLVGDGTVDREAYAEDWANEYKQGHKPPPWTPKKEPQRSAAAEQPPVLNNDADYLKDGVSWHATQLAMMMAFVALNIV